MRTVKKLVVAVVALLVVFTALVTAVSMIPRRAIEANVRASMNEVRQDSVMFYAGVSAWRPFTVGDFTNALMLDLAYCVDSSHPLQAAMVNNFAIVDKSPLDALERLYRDGDNADNADVQMVPYPRYWHGNQVVLRPLLCVTTVHGVYVLNIVVLALLWLALLVLLWRRVSPGDALLVSLPLLAVMVPSVPLCMNYPPPFVVGMLGALLVLLCRRVTARLGNAVVLFVVIGACTSFFDLLTAPLVSLGVPLFVYMLYCRPRRACATVVALSLAWLGGYAVLWLGKWVLAALLTGHGVMQDGLDQVTRRAVGNADEAGYLDYCLKRSLQALAAFVALMAVLTLLLGKSWRDIRACGWMLLLAMSSWVWELVVLEHTWTHMHFTWRTFVVLAIGVLLYCCHTMSLRHPLGLFRRGDRY